MYNKRTFLNKNTSPSTGNIACFNGATIWKSKKYRNTFISISDCNCSVRLHKIEDDTMEDFIDKLKLLKNEISDFIDYLEKEKTNEK